MKKEIKLSSMIALPANLNEPVNPTFGPPMYGVKLVINDEFHSLLWKGVPTSVDVETDEKDNFVGVGICQDDKVVYYFSQLSDNLKKFLASVPIIGHNIKFDLKLLKKWEVDINPNQLAFDTCLASYVVNTTKESHHLKDLGKEILNMIWPTYKEMVGTGKKKETLDKQEVGRVAAYCGMDTLVTFKLYQYFLRIMNPLQRRILETIELPVARILMQMELNGVSVDTEYLQKLDLDFRSRITELDILLKTQWYAFKGQPKEGDKPFNLNSNRQVAELLEAQGAVLPSTQKGNKKVDKATLENWKQLPCVALLLEYNKLEKLVSTYTTGLLEKQQNGKIYASFNQITKNAQGQESGISTGRLSSSAPNLQNIPIRTQEGGLIRRVFIPSDGKVFIDSDYSQIEYRLLAHFSKEPRLIQAFLEGKDVHEETGRLLGCSRDIGKTLNFASIYGAQAAKIAKTAHVSEQEAEKFLTAYWKYLPRVTAWINRVKFEARAKRGIFTLLRRWIPLPGITSQNRFERMHWERAAVNYVIQGSAAEIMKLALIGLNKKGYLPVMTVHDEFIFEEHDDPIMIKYGPKHIKEIMESVVKLDVPLIADVGTGPNWAEAKGD